ncbi:Uncharacterised protein [Brucella anthropi]|nr:Uncharacterised protein [Brucella anthropi]
MLINRTPKPEFFSSAFDDHFVQIPNIAGARLTPPQVACDLGAELGDPTTNCLV